MRKIFGLMLAVFISLLVSAGAASAQKTVAKNRNCAAPSGLTEAEINAVLDAHNQIRVEIGLEKLKWNCQLAGLAQEWATRGVFEHRDDTEYGENLFVSSNSGVSAVTALQTWLAEKPFWDNAQGVCAAGKVCMHYTQLVSRPTTEFGCGINRAAPGKWKVLMVCNYDQAVDLEGKAY